jgi:hypothetical protein
MAQKIDRFLPLREFFIHFTLTIVGPKPCNFGSEIEACFAKVRGQVPIERGGALLYTIGPTGEVAVTLYPAMSSLAKPFEDHIFVIAAISSLSGCLGT